MCRFRRHETTHLSHECDKGSLAQQGRLTGHVRSRDNDDLLFLSVQAHVIGNILLSRRKFLFNHRMASLPDVEHIVVRNDRTNVTILLCGLGKRQQTVQTCQ